jgi:glucan 1,3-beta-glucosidase
MLLLALRTRTVCLSDSKVTWLTDSAHSGLSDGKVRFWNAKANLRSTSLALRFLASYLSPIPHVVGLELLNEPAYDDKLWGWYDTTISEIRSVAGSSLPLVISDSWRTDDFAGYVGGKNQGLVLDHHLYRCFTAEDRIMGEAHAQKLRNEFIHSFTNQAAKANGSVIVGEFSAALNPGSFPDGMSDGDKDHQKRLFLRAEIDVMECCCAGWYFWSLKKEEGWDCGWSAKDAATAEILPAWVGGRKLRHDLSGDWGREACAKQAYGD